MVSGAPLVEATGLVKVFGRTRALDGLDLLVAPGEVHGFLGPNGAGKSTTLRVLLGQVRVTAGSVRVVGFDPWSDGVRVRRNVAYVPGDVNLWPGLTGGEVIDLLTSLRGGADPRLRRELIEEFDFDPRRKARTYSKGNRQKAALIAAFARPARLYLLDEPSSGLDPVMDAVFRRQVHRVRSEGATVLLSSHILSEVEQLCDRVSIIRAGVLVESGSLAELRHLSRTHFRVAGPGILQRVAASGCAHGVRRDGAAVEFDVDPADLDRLLAVLAQGGVEALSTEPPSLESMFLRHYGTSRPGRS